MFRYFRSLGHLNLAPGYAIGQSRLECGPSHAIRINHLRGFGHSSPGQQGQQLQPLPICPAHTLLTRALSHFFRKGPNEINSIPHIYTAYIWESTVFTCLCRGSHSALTGKRNMSLKYHYYWFSTIFIEISLKCIICMAPSILNSVINLFLVAQSLTLVSIDSEEKAHHRAAAFCHPHYFQGESHQLI